MDAVFINRFAATGPGVRVAVKDLLDLAGTITTAGCKEVERRALPAPADAACIAGIRAAEARGEAVIVGKTNLHELAFGADGINAAYGTPSNPLDPDRIPGGSSSGSAVAVATHEADVALGSDTGGSVRIPAACCGIVGLKTTWGRVPLTGCWPLAPFLDTIGPMARTVGDVIVGMDLLEPGFGARAAAVAPATTVGLVRFPSGGDPAIDVAVSEALRLAELTVVDVEVPMWEELREASLTVLVAEAWRVDRHLLDRPDSLVSPLLQERLRLGATIGDDVLAAARTVRDRALEAIRAVFRQVQLVALPSVPVLAPLLSEAATAPLTACTRAGNLLGTPSLSLPVPVPAAHRVPATAHLPASLQLLGPLGSEELLVRTGGRIEAAVR